MRYCVSVKNTENNVRSNAERMLILYKERENLLLGRVLTLKREKKLSQTE